MSWAVLSCLSNCGEIWDINEKDALEIYVDEDKIILKKYEPACIFCNQSVDTVVYKGKNICANCLAELKK